MRVCLVLFLVLFLGFGPISGATVIVEPPAGHGCALVEPEWGRQWLSDEVYGYANRGVGEPNCFDDWQRDAVEHATVPEPMTFLMLALGSVLVLGRGRMFRFSRVG